MTRPEQLTLDDPREPDWAALPRAPDGECELCARHRDLWRYGPPHTELCLCEDCIRRAERAATRTTPPIPSPRSTTP